MNRNALLLTLLVGCTGYRDGYLGAELVRSDTDTPDAPDADPPDDAEAGDAESNAGEGVDEGAGDDEDAGERAGPPTALIDAGADSGPDDSARDAGETCCERWHERFIRPVLCEEMPCLLFEPDFLRTLDGGRFEFPGDASLLPSANPLGPRDPLTP